MENTEEAKSRMENALYVLNDEIMSILHSHQLKDAKIDSEFVVAWMRELYGFVQEGLGKESPFKEIR